MATDVRVLVDNAEVEPADESGEYSIYGLIDPRNLAVRYIGCTSNVINRVRLHLYRPMNDDLANWFADLKSAGLTPRVVVFAFGLSPAEAGRLEEIYIDEYSINGAPLLNRDIPAQRKAKVRNWYWAQKWWWGIRDQALARAKASRAEARIALRKEKRASP